MDGAQFAKMLSDKHLLNSIGWNTSTRLSASKNLAELLRQNFAQPLPLTDFSGNKLFYLPNLAQISTNGMKQLLSVPVSGQNFGLSAMTEEIYATFQIESIRSTRSSIRYILDGYAPVINRSPHLWYEARTGVYRESSEYDHRGESASPISDQHRGLSPR